MSLDSSSDWFPVYSFGSPLWCYRAQREELSGNQFKMCFAHYPSNIINKVGLLSTKLDGGKQLDPSTMALGDILDVTRLFSGLL